MQQEMTDFFIRLVESWENKGQLPQVKPNRKADPDFYIGRENEDGQVGWLPVAKEEAADFSGIEEVIGIKFHPSIKEYFNTYYFARLSGYLPPFRIRLHPVLPGLGIYEWGLKLVDYRKQHRYELDYIPIGVETKSKFPVVVNNETGRVYVEDEIEQVVMPVAESIADLIGQLKLKSELDDEQGV